MSKRKNLQVVFPLKSEEEFLKAVADSDRYLTVVDIHQTWSGPCTVMEPLYRKAFIELEQPEQRLKCYTIEAEKLSPQSRTGLPVNDSCKPLFVVYKNKIPIAKVQGALAPSLETAIWDNIPPVPKDDEGAE